MKARPAARRRRPSAKRTDDIHDGMATSQQQQQNGCRENTGFYASGAMVRGPGKTGRGPGNTVAGQDQSERVEQPAPSVGGRGVRTTDTAYGQSVRLQGRTDASFDGGAYHTENVRATRGEGCEGCSRRQCVHVTGILVATYSVATTVTLPSVSDFPDLTPCQRERVQSAITDTLAPHEQDHVAAFSTYNGTTRRRFELTLCRNAFDDAIREMHRQHASDREAAAQARSDALDPFHFDVDLDCEDDSSGSSTSAAQSVASAKA